MKEFVPTDIGDQQLGTVIYQRSGRTLTQNGLYVTKAGKDVYEAEASALKIAQSIDVPVPVVHSLEATSEDVSITMDFIKGETLEECWPRLSYEQKLDIASQLKGILERMRACLSPDGIISNCDHGPIRNIRYIATYTGGPFHDEEAFNDFILDFYNRTPLEIQQGFRKRFNDKSHRICFTHTDLSQRNIMVYENKIVAILDWEYAGWYPEYWEYISFFDRHSKAKDWWSFAQYIFPQAFNDELLDYQGVARWQKR